MRSAPPLRTDRPALTTHIESNIEHFHGANLNVAEVIHISARRSADTFVDEPYGCARKTPKLQPVPAGRLSAFLSSPSFPFPFRP